MQIPIPSLCSSLPRFLFVLVDVLCPAHHHLDTFAAIFFTVLVVFHPVHLVAYRSRSGCIPTNTATLRSRSSPSAFAFCASRVFQPQLSSSHTKATSYRTWRTRLGGVMPGRGVEDGGNCIWYACSPYNPRALGCLCSPSWPYTTW